MSLSIWQILLVAVLFILLFGRGRIPALMGDLAEGIRSFKKGIAEDQTEPSASVVKSTPTDKSQPAPQGEAAVAVKTEVDTGQQLHRSV